MSNATEGLKPNKSDTPLVSVIVPNYNYARFLPQRIDSILNQSISSIELIILDDASTDESMSVINTYAERPRVRVIANEENSGNVFRQWKKGIDAAKADLVWIAEADDYCEPNFLASLLPCMDNPDVVLAYSDSIIVDETGTTTGDYAAYYKALKTKHWNSSHCVDGLTELNTGLGIKNTIPNVSAVLFRKNALTDKILKKAPRYKLSGDWFIYTQLVKDRKVAFCAEKLNAHRKHSQTVTSQTHSLEHIHRILNEAASIHSTLLTQYGAQLNTQRMWKRYVKEQIQALFPGTPERDFDRFYPYSHMKKRFAIAKGNARSKRTALIVSHMADLSGAPQIILNMARHLADAYDIHCVCLLLQDGPLREEFARTGEVRVVDHHTALMEDGTPLLDFLAGLTPEPEFALVNTACCGLLMPVLEQCAFPVVSFIHDYTYCFPEDYLRLIYEKSDHIVYSTDFMVQKNIKDFPFDQQKTSIIPQGLYKKELLTSGDSTDLSCRQTLNIPEDAFVVLGCASIHPRKGVDVFINTAMQTLATRTAEQDIFFVWLGGELRSDSPDPYNRFLARDLLNSGLDSHIIFVDAATDVTPYYNMADIFFLSSREDPLPTVVFEAFAARLAVIGVDGSSGSIELLERCDNFVVPYAERASVAELILKLSKEPDTVKAAGQRGHELVAAQCDFSVYVKQVKGLLINGLLVDEGMFSNTAVEQE